MVTNNEKFEYINNQDDLDCLISRIAKGPLFAEAFKFQERYFFLCLLEYLKIDIEDFQKNYFYFDKTRSLHISESEFKYVWISTYGLVAKGKETDNSIINACLNQYTVLSPLVDKAIELISNEDVYDVDSYNFGCLSSLSPALFNNILFYIEIFGKAYLSLSGVGFPHTHELSRIYSLVTETMLNKNHNNTFLHLLINDSFQEFIEHVSTMPVDFKEQFVKYDDNPKDCTLILFDVEQFIKLKNAIGVSNDFIYSYYCDGESSFELESGILERLINKAKNKEEKQDIIDRYGHLKT